MIETRCPKALVPVVITLRATMMQKRPKYSEDLSLGLKIYMAML
jgi:hypothetical protein